MTPNHDESIDFLNRWAPGGPWTLTAINPNDKKKITTQTFRDSGEVRRWLSKFGVDRNVYFAVNPLLRDVQKKAEREDVASLAWLHVDVDPAEFKPPAGTKDDDLPALAAAHFAAEQARILALFEGPPAGVPAPTCIVFSGGGYQGFWKLEEPFKIDGKEELYEEATLWNRQLELLFGADHCHNVDRIMRLPGTINRPDAKKRKKGRVEALASTVRWLDAAYPLTVFVKAPPVQGAVEGFSGHSVKVSGNVRRIENLDTELPAGLPDYCKVVIAQGHHPDDADKHGGSRSEWLFYACCELVRAGCDDDTIYSIITDPDWGISKSVLDKRGSAERYAIRQIERARENAIDPNLMFLNERHAVIGSMGGKCRIICEEEDVVLSRSRLAFQTSGDFKLRYGNRMVDVPAGNGKVVHVPLGQWWLNHSNRRQYEGIVFAPERDVPGYYNLWRGFAFEAKPGDCGLYLAHVRSNVCTGNEEYYNYLLDWMALAVQKPAQPGHVAVVLRGRMGTGKGVFIRGFGRLFGRHFMHVSNPQHLVGNFNAHLRDCVVLFADEAFYAGDKKHESILKTIVTEETQQVEAKGIDTVEAPNFIHLMMASNSQWIVPSGKDERRYFVLDVGAGCMQDRAYFSAIQRQLESGGYEALLHDLMARDVSTFDPRAMPRTAALQEQKVLSFTAEEEWWYNKLRAGEITEGRGWPTHVVGVELVDNFTAYTKQWGNSSRSNETRLGTFMRNVCPEGWILRGQLSGRHTAVVNGSVIELDRPRAYRIPPLAESRAHWDAHFGGPYDWAAPVAIDHPAELAPF